MILAAMGIQLRLICNLLDGMVAVEHGRAGKTGVFWNEVPDRFSDTVILAGAGLAAGSLSLGLAAALGAVITAYLRAAAAAEGFEQDFQGPMAKTHRMALMTGYALLAAIMSQHAANVLLAALALVLAGTIATSVMRARRFLHNLEMR